MRMRRSGRNWVRDEKGREYSVLADCNEGEMSSVLDALRDDVEWVGEGNTHEHRSHIFLDSKVAGAYNTQEWKWEEGFSYLLVSGTRTATKELQERGGLVVLHWIPSHVGVKEHDRADEIAKQHMASLSRKLSQVQEMKRSRGDRRKKMENMPAGEAGLTLSSFQHLIERSIRHEWDDRWQKYKEGARLRRVFPELPKKSTVRRNWQPQGKNWTEIARGRLRYGHCALNEYLWTSKVRTDPYCETCMEEGENGEEETREHFLFYCPTYANHRQQFTTSTGLTCIDSIQTWFGCNSTMTDEQNTNILKHLDIYIAHTLRFKRNDAKTEISAFHVI